MIKFFRQSYAVQYVVIGLLAIALWIPSFWAGKVVVGLDSPVTPLYNLINRILGFSTFVQLLFAFLLMLLEALVFNTILVNNQIIGKVSTMGAFVFVLMMNLTRTQANFFPFALSVVFILLAINTLFNLYLAQKPELDLLRSGIFVALASMCYFPAIVLILWVIIALQIAKKVSFRLGLIPLVGFCSVYFFYFVGMYLFGDFLSMIHAYRDWFMGLRFSVSGFNVWSIVLLVFLFVTALLLVFGNSNLEKTVAVRVKMTMTMLLLLLGLLLLFMGGNVLMNGLVFIVLAIVFSYAFTYLSNPGWASLILSLFMLLVFANHYYFKLL